MSHYRQVAQAFDGAAASYDRLYRGNWVMSWMRAESLRALRDAFPHGSHLLEIGCGTGEEALELGKRGYRIVATDISPAMIDVAQAKALDQGQTGVTWRVLAAGQLPDLLDEYGEAGFDGAYASFGALNCEPRLEDVVTGLSQLLRPGGIFVCSVMNRWCAWEIGWGLVHFRPWEAFRRLREGWVAAGLAGPKGRVAVPTRYYTPSELLRAFGPYFRPQRVVGLTTFLPPPYLDHLLERFPGLFGRLVPVERRLRERFPFYALGDHFLAVLARRSDETLK